MPRKMSIEVVKHKDDDFRLIFKSGNLVIRQRFVRSSDLLTYLLSEIKTDSIFDN